MKHKAQHIIPKCYLRAWSDPNAPARQTPYIWLISKDGRETKRRAPHKAFTESDKYTIKLPTGQRELVIENTLGQIESTFVHVLDLINKQRVLDDFQRANLCIFAAAMSIRTKYQEDNFGRFFSKIHELTLHLEHTHTVPPRASLETGLFATYAHPIAIAMTLEQLPHLFFQMNMTILQTDDDLGFITSDEPCVWFNPEAHKMPPFYRSPGLAQEKIEVTLPLSPKYMLFLTHSFKAGYLRIPTRAVDDLNRRTRAHSREHFVSWNGKTKPIWFHMGTMPEDAWEKTHPQRPEERETSEFPE
jgi:hypothetical protein